jgi:hypothetical protein
MNPRQASLAKSLTANVVAMLTANFVAISFKATAIVTTP